MSNPAHIHHHLSYPPPPLEREGNGEDEGGQQAAEKPREVLIYFIPGNPGLIDYYEPFLTTLRELLDTSPSPSSSSASLSSSSSRTATTTGRPRFHIYGQDLAGFNDGAHREPFTSRRPPHDLEYQIQHSLAALRRLCFGVPETTAAAAEAPGQKEPERTSYDEVLLVGHSVGAYIALELCHRVLKASSGILTPAPAPTSTPSSSAAPSAAQQQHPRLDAAVLLFPTIEHIARSPSGWKLDLLRRTPVLGARAHRVARGFLGLWPAGALRWFVGRVLGFPPPAAAATARWLKTPDGVWQALHMGMDEMRVIGEARWDDELWGVVAVDRQAAAAQKQDQNQEQQQTPDREVTATTTTTTTTTKTMTPRFYFFFGRDDHWVATHHRDEFIRRRQRQVERTRVVVDESDIPHAFCINHSEPVAEKAHVWIKEMYGVQ
ncbi:hypothetical protein F4809DRAFT_604349 [Biscogniauxia mediterranea]|nr:hypothetical protein F4809DRAFT_604349 [Biscogniauxia mediterranea]